MEGEEAVKRPFSSSGGAAITFSVAEVSKLRGLIHDALEYLFRYAPLPRVDLDFKKAFGATDTLLDVETALFSFEHLEWPNDLGQSYLLTYGILQALVIQQDAAKWICEVFGTPFNRSLFPELQQARELRVRTAGHPARHGPRRPNASTFLVRQIFSRERAVVVTIFDEENRWEHQEINLLQLYKDQQAAIEKILLTAWNLILAQFPEAAGHANR
jgi:hypothetical protein